MICAPDNDGIVVLSPRPLLWLSEFEAANPRAQPAMLWREIGQKSRQRGNPAAGRGDWPGSVLMPSFVCADLLRRATFRMPQGWQRHSLAADACLFSLLCGWQTERAVVEFSELTGALLKDCSVNLTLREQLFSNLPWQAFYLDFESCMGDAEGLPYGVFVGLDQSSKGRMRLLFAADFGERLDLLVVPLSGDPIDDVISRMTAMQRKSEQSAATPMPALSPGSLESLLHLALSATLMTCANQARLQVVEDGAEMLGARPPWVRWKAGNGIDESVQEKLQRAQQPDRGSPLLVAEWREAQNGGVAQLHCSAGYGYLPVMQG